MSYAYWHVCCEIKRKLDFDEEKARTSFILLDAKKVEKEEVYDEKTREIINGFCN